MTSDAATFRFRHTMVRIGDLDQSLDADTRRPGMRLRHRLDGPEKPAMLAVVGYGPADRHAAVG